MTTDNTPLSLAARVEAIIFAAPRPLTAEDIVEIIAEKGVGVAEIKTECQQLLTHYHERGGGFYLEEEDGYRFQTVGSAAAMLKRLNRTHTRPLSRAAMETLAIVAYRQPVTRAEIEYVRGVDSGNLVRAMLERKLITCIGRRDGVGKPLLFATSPDFLRVFALKSLEELPPLESFQIKEETRKLAEQKITTRSTPDVDEMVGGKE